MQLNDFPSASISLTRSLSFFLLHFYFNICFYCCGILRIYFHLLLWLRLHLLELALFAQLAAGKTQENSRCKWVLPRGEGEANVRTACAAAMGTRRYLYHPKGHKGVGTWHAACGKRRLHVATKLTAKCEYVFVILGDSNQRRGGIEAERIEDETTGIFLCLNWIRIFQGISEISSTPWQQEDIRVVRAS